MAPTDKSKALALVNSCNKATAFGVWVRLTTEAKTAQNAQLWARAIFLLEVAVEAGRQLHNDGFLVQSLNGLAMAYFSQRNYEQAEKSFAEAENLAEKLNLKPDMIYNLCTLGAIHLRSGKYASAREYSLRAISATEALSNETSEPFLYGRAVAYDNLGYIALWQGEISQALHHLQKSNQYYEQLEGSFRSRYKGSTSKSLLGIAFVYYTSGDYGQALAFYNRALAVAQAGAKTDLALAATNGLGILYLDQGDYAKATEFLTRALAASENNEDGQYRFNALHNLALIDQRQGKYRDAASKFSELLALAEKNKLTDQIAPQLEGLGSAYHKLGQYGLAMDAYNRGLEIAGRLGDRIRQCELTWYKGGAYYDLKQYDRSLDMSVLAAKMADDISEPNLSYLALTQAGKARLALGQNDLGRADLLRAIERAEQIRSRIRGQEQERALFFERKIEPYYLMVELLSRQGKPQEALLFAERARSRALLDLFGQTGLDMIGALSAEERDEEKRLNGQLAALNSQLYNETQESNPDKQLLADLNAKVGRARVDYDSLLDRLYTSHPELKINRGNATPLVLDELRTILPSPDSVALEFEVLEDKTYLFALGLDASGVVKASSYLIAASAKSLQQKVEGLRERIGNRGLGVDKLSTELYTLLIAPAANDIKGKTTLVLVPDGVLWDLPFQALRSNNRYLIEDHSVFYAPSLTALREMTRRKQSTLASTAAGASTEKEPSPTLLAFGNPALTFRQPDQAIAGKLNQGGATDSLRKTSGPATVAKRDDPLGPLPEAETEVQTLATLYGPDRSRVFIGPDATEEKAKAEMGRFSVLHFAAHGILDSTNPLYSHIVLSQAGVPPSGVSQAGASQAGGSQAGVPEPMGAQAGVSQRSQARVAGIATQPAQAEVSIDDGLLEAREIMNMNLKADLAVLSACQTARGRISTGEGVIGMSWAFFAAGCPTTVVSQWSVESQSTTELMIEFHRNLLSGQKMSKAEALRQASLKLLRTEKYRHPFYWAGFIVMGDGR
jgi:CHAT domain-containing protein/tetratricopeptide (TPR) repeat protein